MNVTFRPIGDEARAQHHERSRFEAGWEATLSLLSYELGKLEAKAAVIRLALESEDIRLDGWPRARAVPARPEVIIEWQIGSQWSRMAATKYDHWQDNVRAAALTLDALRAVERWGVVEGEQYEGLRLELEPAVREISTREQAQSFVLDRLFVDDDHSLHSLATPDDIRKTYRRLASRLRPDAGGDPEEFRKLQQAKDLLLGENR